MTAPLLDCAGRCGLGRQVADLNLEIVTKLEDRGQALADALGALIAVWDWAYDNLTADEADAIQDIIRPVSNSAFVLTRDSRWTAHA